ncbi:hypothetical protein SAMN05421510_102911 [Nitrosomonas ureae]|uniref:Uncharacterized protein n=1 Tax=Nitrosomonas ureae TaxID=44577 RepID=A0A1H9EAH0_9PROT|nr:hypothetical protein SAMN05421510_102911 [Nitrosomonas ureae]
MQNSCTNRMHEIYLYGNLMSHAASKKLSPKIPQSLEILDLTFKV